MQMYGIFFETIPVKKVFYFYVHLYYVISSALPDQL